MTFFCLLCIYSFEVLHDIMMVSRESKFSSKREKKIFSLSFLLKNFSLKIVIQPFKIFQFKQVLFIKLSFSFPVRSGLF